LVVCVLFYEYRTKAAHAAEEMFLSSLKNGKGSVLFDRPGQTTAEKRENYNSVLIQLADPG